MSTEVFVAVVICSTRIALDARSFEAGQYAFPGAMLQLSLAYCVESSLIQWQASVAYFVLAVYPCR